MAVKLKALSLLEDKEGNFKLRVLQHPLFLWGLLLKVGLSFFFAGRLMANYFIPFISYYVNSGWDDPYTYFEGIGMSEAFPYPPLMLYLLTFLGGGLSGLSPFFMRIPLLLADTAVLVILSRWLRMKDAKLLRYYWFSPVLIYISYIHGQFDVIPIAFLIIALYLIIRKNFMLSALVMGLGLATKTNLVLAVPFMILYLWKSSTDQRIKKIGVFSIILISGFLLPSFPYLYKEAFQFMVYQNLEQDKVWTAGLPMIGSLQFYLIPAVYLVLLAAATRFRKFSKDLFVMFIGFSFALLLLFIPPQPGWYFWILPFLIYFNLKEQKLTYLPMWALQLAFLLYFALIPLSDYSYVFLWTERDVSLYQLLSQLQWVNAEVILNLTFTLLQTILVLNVYWIFKAGIRKNLNRKLRTKPFLVGIGGDSGVGKSTLTELLIALFGEENVTIIRGDDMHRWERGHDKWNELTHLSPKANHLHEDIKHLKLLRTGKAVYRRLYDHSSGKFTKPRKVNPQKLVIFEGLHPFYIAAKRNLFDLKIFIEPEENLRLYWKLKRDISNRGYTRDKVLEQLKMRAEDSEKYIRSQAPFSDIRIRFSTISEIPKINDPETPELELHISLDNNLDINQMVEIFSEHSNLEIQHEYEMDCQTLKVIGKISTDEMEQLIFLLVKDVDELLDKTLLKDNLNGFLQLFLMYCIQIKADNP